MIRTTNEIELSSVMDQMEVLESYLDDNQVWSAEDNEYGYDLPGLSKSGSELVSTILIDRLEDLEREKMRIQEELTDGK